MQPPVGISYLKSSLAASGVRTICLDLSRELYNDFDEKKYWDLNFPEHFIVPALFYRDILPRLGDQIQKWAQRIIGMRPKAVGMSLFVSSINMSILLAKQIKKLSPNMVIIGGGAEVTKIKNRVMRNKYNLEGLSDETRELFNNFDVLVDGEGEEALPEILEAVDSNKTFKHINGVLYYSGKVCITCERTLLKNLDAVPPPDFSDFNLNDYEMKRLPIVTSRGCVNKCTFCAESPLWRTYRYLSAEKVVADIKHIVKRYGVNFFEIVDSTLNGNIDRLEKICELIIASKIPLRWSAKATLNKGMTKTLLKKMAQAGCLSLSYGVESGSPRVLKDMRKNIDLSCAVNILKDTKEAGIEGNCFFMIGYPTEKEEDFQLTLDFINNNAALINQFDHVTGCHIEEGSYLGLNCDKYGIEFKEDGWYCQDNTPAIRKDRLRRFRDQARKVHKHYVCEVQQ
ncbi:MAG: B12-binding domain-containing radical SAM protein [Candidatus Omnitrophica bacterium]|nr:B12-binding domain-containing radical SAM protein [Candidatus Omnitrophota bacterium]